MVTRKRKSFNCKRKNKTKKEKEIVQFNSIYHANVSLSLTVDLGHFKEHLCRLEHDCPTKVPILRTLSSKNQNALQMFIIIFISPSNGLATYFSLFTLYALTYFSSLPNFPSSSHKIQTDKGNLIHIPLLKTLGIGSKGVGSSKGDTVADAADFTSDGSILLGWISSLAPSEMATVLATFGRPLDGDFSNLAVASLESDLSC